MVDLLWVRLTLALIPKEYWSYPEWVDQERAARSMKDMEQRNIIYGGSLSYRHMCRFNSGFFYRLDVMQKYDYYWRIEPCISFVLSNLIQSRNNIATYITILSNF
jgi:Glycolipid 2-alpha-mannosyltransferase